MACEEIKKLNEAILLNAHAACNRDIGRACVCFGLNITTAEAIAKTSIDTLKTISNNATALIYPALIPIETWNNIDFLKDDALSTITITQIIPNR